MQVDDIVGSHFEQEPYNDWSLFPQQVTSIYTWRKSFLFHMVPNKEEVIAMAAITSVVLENKAREKRKRKLWVKPWLQRSQLGVFSTFTSGNETWVCPDKIFLTFHSFPLSQPNEPLSFWKPNFFTCQFDYKKNDVMYKDVLLFKFIRGSYSNSFRVDAPVPQKFQHKLHQKIHFSISVDFLGQYVAIL